MEVVIKKDIGYMNPFFCNPGLIFFYTLKPKQQHITNVAVLGPRGVTENVRPGLGT